MFVYVAFFIFSLFVIPSLLNAIFLAVCLLLYCHYKKTKISIVPMKYGEFFLLGFTGWMISMAYVRLGEVKILISFLTYFINPCVLFVVSYNVVVLVKGGFLKLRGILYAMFCGGLVHIILNTLVNVGRLRWELIDFFSGELQNATNLASPTIIIYAFVIAIFLCKDKKLKLFGFMALILSLNYSFLLGTRSQLLQLIILAGMGFLIFLWENKAKFFTRSILRFLLAILLSIVCIAALYHWNVFEIQERVFSSNLWVRLFAQSTANSDQIRFKMFFDGLLSLVNQPFGGERASEYSYFHNYWLDLGCVAGMIPVVCTMIYDISAALGVKCIFQRKNVNRELKYILWGLFFGMIINFFLEPVLDGYFDLYYQYLVVSSVLICLRKKEYKEVEPLLE